MSWREFKLIFAIRFGGGLVFTTVAVTAARIGC